MSGNQPGPSADELKDRVDEMGEQANLGAGDEEADPATAQNPPEERREGDAKRSPA
jgi:hypothetical protein